MEDCLFCRIVRKEIPAHIVYEDDAALAFLDIHPHAKGHTVVIPKHHAADLAALPREAVGPLFEAVRAVAAKAVPALQADGLTIGVNQGAVSGQTVHHLHVHILPRFHGDGGGSIHSAVKAPSGEPLAEIAKILTIERS